MKKVRMIVSAALVFAVVGGALAFKPFNAGTIYCVANGSASSVNTSLSCTATGQPASTKIDYAVSTNTQDPTDNPCLSTQTPFDGSVSGACTQTTPGTTHYKTTAQ
jgi:hypothetical protein